MNSVGLSNAQLDRFGMTASLLCAVHCAFLPQIVVLMTAFGLSHEALELPLLGSALVLALVSLVWGFRKHGNWRSLILGGISVAAIGVGHELHEVEHVLARLPLVLGGLGLAAAHFWNLRMCRSCINCQATDARSTASITG
jgi:hypothetical protein